jgi:hypothetical protein
MPFCEIEEKIPVQKERREYLSMESLVCWERRNLRIPIFWMKRKRILANETTQMTIYLLEHEVRQDLRSTKQ